MLANLGVSFHEFSEFLIFKMLFSEGNDMAEEMAGAIVAPVIDEEVKARGEFYNALVDKRMLALFMLFDLGTFIIVVVLGKKKVEETIVFPSHTSFCSNRPRRRGAICGGGAWFAQADGQHGGFCCCCRRMSLDV